MSTEEKFLDADGNQISLDKLVRTEPDWAVNQIRRLRLMEEKFRAFLEGLEMSHIDELLQESPADIRLISRTMALQIKKALTESDPLKIIGLLTTGVKVREKKDPEVKLYRPANGTEGIIFTEKFCDHCALYNEEDGCEILEMTLFFELDDDKYPPEWQYGEDGMPKCTKFEKRT